MCDVVLEGGGWGDGGMGGGGQRATWGAGAAAKNIYTKRVRRGAKLVSFGFLFKTDTQSVFSLSDSLTDPHTHKIPLIL